MFFSLELQEGVQEMQEGGQQFAGKISMHPRIQRVQVWRTEAQQKGK